MTQVDTLYQLDTARPRYDEKGGYSQLPPLFYKKWDNQVWIPNHTPGYSLSKNNIIALRRVQPNESDLCLAFRHADGL